MELAAAMCTVEPYFLMSLQLGLKVVEMSIEFRLEKT